MNKTVVSQGVHILREEDLPFEGFGDPACGAVSWRSFSDSDSHPTHSLTSGIAYFSPGQELKLHRHEPAELYFILEGELDITIDGTTRRVGANTSLFIPGNILHGVRNSHHTAARLFYCFAKDRLSDIEYVFDKP